MTLFSDIIQWNYVVVYLPTVVVTLLSGSDIILWNYVVVYLPTVVVTLLHGIIELSGLSSRASV